MRASASVSLAFWFILAMMLLSILTDNAYPQQLTASWLTNSKTQTRKSGFIWSDK